MLLWKPDSSQLVIIYVLAGVWAVGDSVHQTILSGKPQSVHINVTLTNGSENHPL